MTDTNTDWHDREATALERVAEEMLARGDEVAQDIDLLECETTVNADGGHELTLCVGVDGAANPAGENV